MTRKPPTVNTCTKGCPTPNTQHPQPPKPTDKIPLLGYDPNSVEYESILLFATERIQFSESAGNMVYQKDKPDVQRMTPVNSGTPIEAYFGCWPDINPPNRMLIPSGGPSGNPDGLFASNSVLSIPRTFGLAPHQCLVAEISYDPITIPNDLGGLLDKLTSKPITGKSNTEVRITSKGQVTIPQEFRERFGLLANTEAEFVATPDGKELRLLKSSKPSGRGAYSLSACADEAPANAPPTNCSS